MPVKVLIVGRGGEVAEASMKNPQCDTLYRKCGFKRPDDFTCRTTWNVKVLGEWHCVRLYSRDTGKAGSENKYDFPPPVDSELYFGKCMLMSVLDEEDDIFGDLTLDLWEKIYERLFGGFEDLTATAAADENEEDELDEIPDELKTKNGYLKDGFVVDDSDDIEEDEEDEEEDEYELEIEEYEASDDEDADK